MSAQSVLFVAIAVALTVVSKPTHAQEAPPPADDGRVAWWREARFGLFIHWGVYSVPAGRWDGQPVPSVGEWIMQTAKIPVARYEPLATQFTAEHYDPAAWAKLAREAGMRYVVITSKHHDGFALWDSALSDWDVERMPGKRDLLAPLAEACRAEGLRFGLYHSIMDWHHADYAPRRPWHGSADGEPDFDRFRQYLHGQVGEIVTRYQPDVLWFDGEWEETWTTEHGRSLAAHARGLKPDIIINNRVGKARNDMAGLNKAGVDPIGDFGTPEQEIPSTGLPGADWESCMTMNDTWGFKADDANWKSSRTLIRNLIECASKGGNYLLNVGPTPDGRIPEESVERLRAIGRWMAVNGEAIYGTQAGPFARLPWGRATQRGDVVYLFVYDWPEDRVLWVPMASPVVSASLLAVPGERLVVLSGESGARITLPARMLDTDATVVKLEIAGEPTVLAVPNARQRADGRIELSGRDADLHGGIRIEQIDGQPSAGFWTSAEGRIAWAVQVDRPGTFAVELEFACEPASAGSTVALSADCGGEATFEVPSTGSWSRFNTADVGTIAIDKSGLVTLGLEAKVKSGNGVMNLRRITLVPAP